MYTIKIRYTTGNSFGSNIEEENIEMQWSTIAEAKRALNSIKEHFIYYKKSQNHFSYRPSQKIKDDLKKEAEGKEWWSSSEYTIELINSQGTKETCNAFWMGYFEQIHEATIVASVDDELSVNFDSLRWEE